MGSPVSPVIANIYMEYSEELALGPHCLIPTPWWKRYVHDIIFITKNVHVNILFDYINQIDDHIKFTMEHQDKEGSIPSLTLCVAHTPANLYKLQCIENPLTLTDTWIGTITIQYLQKGQ